MRIEEFVLKKDGTEPVSFYRTHNANYHLGTELYVHKIIIPPVDNVKIFSDTVSNILRGL